MQIQINSQTQSLTLLDNEQVLKEYLISTGKNGMGEQMHSEKTPRGWHQVRAKIGAGAEPHAVFIGRRPTGEICTPELYEQQPGRDWILTRILWLSGLEPGKNRWGEVDTMRRYIYIHGTPDWVKMGQPGSRGCIRMANDDIIELFDHINVGTRVFIT